LRGVAINRDEETIMSDALMVLGLVAFFGLSAGLLALCDRV
jgi:hypothetical protein